MRRSNYTVWIVAIVAVLLLTGTMLATAAAQKADVPKPQNTLAIGEDQVKPLLLLMHPDKNGMITREEYMKFMAAEFDRLDKDHKGALDARKLAQSNLSASRFAGK